MRKLGIAFFLGGLLLTFGAVGGMEHEPEASLYLQVLTAAIGLMWMWLGSKMVQDRV